jgi:hypothetical protein
MDPKKTGSAADVYHLSLKTSETFYILNAGIGKYFKDKTTQVNACEFFGFDGQKMGGFGEEYACLTKYPNFNTVKDNLNPDYKNTIKRLINIDSQYISLNAKKPESYVFKLTEKLINVVSIELINLQIPVTFYNI